MRWFCLFATLIPLSGCALPAAVSVASLAIETGSYALSGKTIVDHGLSAVMERDCALIRALEGPVCDEERHYDVALAALIPLPGGGRGSGGGDLDIALAGGPAGGPEAPSPGYRWLLDPAVQIAARPADRELFPGDYLAADVAPGGLPSVTPTR